MGTFSLDGGLAMITPSALSRQPRLASKQPGVLEDVTFAELIPHSPLIEFDPAESAA